MLGESGGYVGGENGWTCWWGVVDMLVMRMGGYVGDADGWTCWRGGVDMFVWMGGHVGGDGEPWTLRSGEERSKREIGDEWKHHVLRESGRRSGCNSNRSKMNRATWRHVNQVGTMPSAKKTAEISAQSVEK